MKFGYEQLKKNWKWDIPKYYNIGRDCTDKWAQTPSHRNKVALRYEGPSGEQESYTFKELALLTNKAANVLLSLGLNKGDRLIIRLPNIPQFPIIFLAAVKIGVIPIPSSFMLTSQELRFLLEDSGAKLIVTTKELYDAVEDCADSTKRFKSVLIVGESVPTGCESLDNLMSKSPDTLSAPLTKADDIAYICYTSGTTGYPKGVVHAQRALIGRDPSVRFWQALKADDTVMHAGKLNWTYTLGTGFLDPWRAGCTSVLWGGDHDVGKFFELIEKYEVNVFMAVPTVYRQMFRTADDLDVDLSSLRHALSAGEHLSEKLYLDWKNKLGVELYDGFGMSEFSYYLSNMSGMPIKPGSPGKPQPGHDCVLLDDNLREVPIGQVGVLATPRNDPGIMLRYWNNADGNDEKFIDDWFISGDYFYRDEDGYFWLVGRQDDMINTFGYRVSPFEVERVLNEHPLINECAVAGVDVGDDKTIATAFVVLHDDRSSHYGADREIIDYAHKRLADYKCPREVVFIDSIPKTINGKIRRKTLSEEYSGTTKP